MVICSYDKKEDEWIPLKTNIDSANNILEAELRSGAIIGVIKDFKKPEINNTVPRNKATYALNDFNDFNIQLTDDFSGVDYQDGIILNINNQSVLTGFNVYQKKIIANVKDYIQVGYNNYELVVYDNAGNKNTIKGRFLIKENLE